ncbi:MAG: hypothetical protein HRU19_25005 [Pseudobacteriovorax sp.]|nr:hypothetical protein [Pseudobacteriovorax sp.]
MRPSLNFVCLAFVFSSFTAAPSHGASQCEYVISGETFTGKNKSDFDNLKRLHDAKKDAHAPSKTTTSMEKTESISCEFKVDGKVHKASSKEACDALETKLNADHTTEKNELSFSCSYDINGVTHTGKSEAECESLRQKFDN